MVTLDNTTQNKIQVIRVSEALDLLRRTKRIALIDVRDRKTYVDEHPVFSINAPIDSLEEKLNQLFGSETGVALIIGQEETLSLWAATVITQITNLQPRLIDGGFSSWKNSGLPTWGGEYTPSKAFGEWVEDTGNIRTIAPKAAMEAPPRYQFDVRPFLEYQKFSLPDSIHCSTGRLGALSISNSSIYVHCAGRTRGIIAAQTMADHDFEAPVHFIIGGTQGWELAGGDRSFNNERSAVNLLSNESMARKAHHLIEKFNLPVVTKDCEKQWSKTGTHYRLITVSEDQIADNDISPTTLIQSTDQYLGTHNLPIVVQGPNQLDCAVSVLWLRRMGWDAQLREKYIPEPVPSRHDTTISVNWDANWLDVDCIFDIRSSKAFKRSRLNNSKWLPRSKFTAISKFDRCLFVCDYSQITHTTELVEQLGLSEPVCIDWNSIPAHLIDTSDIDLETQPIDQARFFPNRHLGDLKDAQGYLDWEHSLLPALSGHGGIPWKPINDALDHPRSYLTTFYQKVKL